MRFLRRLRKTKRLPVEPAEQQRVAGTSILAIQVAPRAFTLPASPYPLRVNPCRHPFRFIEVRLEETVHFPDPQPRIC